MQRAAIAILVAFTMPVAFAERSYSSNAKPELAKPEVQALVRKPADVAADEQPAKPTDATEQPPGKLQPAARVSMDEICFALELAAAVHELPVAFFARLIWQESRFRVDARSPVGARGIAQFMPKTADWRGLEDPLDPIQSLHKSADYLRELRSQFGNLGLAAAAYNGGSGRVQAWLDGRGKMPRETRDYVRIVTGSPIEQWRDKANASAVQAGRIPQKVPCPALVAMPSTAQPDPENDPAPARRAEAARAAKSQQSGWCVQLAGNFSKDKARAHYARLKRKFSSVLSDRKPTFVSRRIAGRGKAPMSVVRIAEDSRADAEKLCARLRTGGASCTVIRNS